MSTINHPLSVGTFIEAKRPKCSCAGGGFTVVSGQVQKVINNQSQTWYFLSCGVTIKSDWVTRVL